jgi:hypothetical protein
LIIYHPEFEGYYTPVGPVGYIKADDPLKVLAVAKAMKEEWPQARVGRLWGSWFSKIYWIRIK